MEEQVLIIGGGIAGLAAAKDLARRGRSVVVIEARERIGGRIHTVLSEPDHVPVELGAEFVHGAKNATWEFLKQARLETEEVPDEHWELRQGKLEQNPAFWQEFSQVLQRINPATPDQDFQSFVDQAWSMSPRAKWLAREYVEGFHAADAGRVSIHSLAQAEAASEQEKGTAQFRVSSGYAELLRWYWNQLRHRDVQFELGTAVKAVRWEPGVVQVRAQTPSGEREYSGRALVVTLPLGVLQDESGQGHVKFDPHINKDQAIRGLAMGSVCKVTFKFKERVWPVENFGFIHSADRSFPTWWSHPRGHLVTGWAGGPRARRLNAEPREAAIAEALRAFSALFKIDQERVRDALASSYFYNWQTDPFSLGAYSFIPARMSEMVAQLAAPVAGTLFFAGEATDTNGDWGTVHGALASGRRAARQVREALRAGRRREIKLAA